MARDEKRRDPGEFYPGGKVWVRPGQSQPQCRVTWDQIEGKPQIAPLPDRYRESDMKGKINEIASKFATVVVAALIGWSACADVTVQKKRKDEIFNDELVVVDILGEGGGTDTNAVREIAEEVVAPVASNVLSHTSQLSQLSQSLTNEIDRATAAEEMKRDKTDLDYMVSPPSPGVPYIDPSMLPITSDDSALSPDFSTFTVDEVSGAYMIIGADGFSNFFVDSDGGLIFNPIPLKFNGAYRGLGTIIVHDILRPAVMTTLALTKDVDAALLGKADRATTLAGYGISDAYTKTETNQKIAELAPAPGNYAAVSNAAMTAHRDAAAYTDAATNAVYSAAANYTDAATNALSLSVSHPTLLWSKDLQQRADSEGRLFRAETVGNYWVGGFDQREFVFSGYDGSMYSWTNGTSKIVYDTRPNYRIISMNGSPRKYGVQDADGNPLNPLSEGTTLPGFSYDWYDYRFTPLNSSSWPSTPYDRFATTNELEKATTKKVDYTTFSVAMSQVSDSLSQKTDKAYVDGNYTPQNWIPGIIQQATDYTDAALLGKADWSTTLEGYSISDAYTKTQADGLFARNGDVYSKIAADEIFATQGMVSQGYDALASYIDDATNAIWQVLGTANSLLESAINGGN